MAPMIKLLILCFVMAIASSLSCTKCPEVPVCDPLPDSEECYSAFAPCACCPTCAGRFGDTCNNLSVRCHPDFVCVNNDGVVLVTVPSYLHFNGICIRKRSPEPNNGVRPIFIGK